ncbi:MAG: hypothetical protein BZ151_09515 [Desulfobacca sp. 4484_104]|nr:MAG: hypothetical protein BZ151_09515 [Desulfobacca sp. 4484_104]
MQKIAQVILWSMLCLGMLVCWEAHAQAALKPYNKVAILIDGSGSYKNRQAQAVAQAVALLEEMAQAKFRRWEQSDEIILIALDAIPDVIFQGSLKELKTVAPDAWVARFKARADYVQHTDLVAAFNLALRHIEGDPRYVSKHLIAFTDLIHDPSGGPAPKKGKAAPPPAEFPFAGLEGVAVTILWCPYPQKQAWLPVLRDNGLGETFQIYTVSESGVVKLTPPPKPKVEQDEGEQAAQRQRVRSWFSLIVWCMAALAASIIILPVVGLIWRRLRGHPRLPGAPRTPTLNHPPSDKLNEPEQH